MPKLKTNRSAAKRFKITKNGKVKASRAGLGHLCSVKSSKRKRKLSKTVVLAACEVKRVKRMLGQLG